ncbi:terminal nucleotidyltransferase 5C-like [Watersipora subatra]|uniref:terminal nucleotidyltransferase 5C-like n=1 Tax=Watersipora subatra TaxID=2589382 RepID=UPI00355C3CBA
METVNNTQAQETLQYHQVLKLNKVYQMPMELHGRGNFPTLEVRMQDLVQKVYSKLEKNGVIIKDVRLNGSTASYIVGDAKTNPLTYNDIDLIFSLDSKSEEKLLCIRDYVMECLLEYFPDGIIRDRLTNVALADGYVSKMTKVWQDNGDKWTLVTLSNNRGMNLEFKFVVKMKRKYQFSVDSFQIVLDSLMQFYELSSTEMSEDFYPTITIESVWGDYQEALSHLNNRLIHTRAPQEIRGGGLLKYCELLARGFKPGCSLAETETIERLMCSRFFIDYSDPTSQLQKLNSYLINHFGGDLQLMVCYLDKLYTVVNTSTVCLMSHERREALHLIMNVRNDHIRALNWHHFRPDCWNGEKHAAATYEDYIYSPSYFPVQQAVALYSGFTCVQHVY